MTPRKKSEVHEVARDARRDRRRLRRYMDSLGPLPGLLLFIQVKMGHKQTKLITSGSTKFWVRLNTNDMDIMYTIFDRQEYRMHASAAPSFIVDAGAYTGLSSVYFAQQYPGATIIAIEPVPVNYELLMKNTSHYPQIFAINKALWFEHGQIEVGDQGYGHAAYSVVRQPGRPFKTTVRAETITVDDIVRDFSIPSIDLLKVDIEGAERELFEHSETWIGTVNAIAIELHDELHEGCSSAFYGATQGFGLEWKYDETVFKARRSAKLGPVQ